jgi:hypothetical protein
VQVLAKGEAIGRAVVVKNAEDFIFVLIRMTAIKSIAD